MPLARFKQHLEQPLFAIPQNIAGLSFRPLLSRFIRPSKKSYVAFDETISKENNPLLPTAFLLGYDPHLILKKIDLKTEHDAIKKLQKAVEKDPIMRDFFQTGTTGKPLHIEIFALKEAIAELKDSLATFKIGIRTSGDLQI